MEGRETARERWGGGEIERDGRERGRLRLTEIEAGRERETDGDRE